jgi:hypothetical protein
MTIQLFSAMFTTRYEKVFGKFRSFKINPDFLIESGSTYTRVDNTGIYPGCPVYQTTVPINLSTDWDGAGRLFLSGTKKIELPAGSHVYLIPEGHQIYSLDSWTRFNAVVRE